MKVDNVEMQFEDAYIQMANTGYRPAAPSDGFGTILLTAEEMEDVRRLKKEAQKYAQKFAACDDAMSHYVGCSDFRSGRALVYTVEAARLMNEGPAGWKWAKCLLRMATDELVSAGRKLS